MEKQNISDLGASAQEKNVEDNLEAKLNKQFPDPDADLSEVARAAIVS